MRVLSPRIEEAQASCARGTHIRSAQAFIRAKHAHRVEAQAFRPAKPGLEMIGL